MLNRPAEAEVGLRSLPARRWRLAGASSLPHTSHEASLQPRDGILVALCVCPTDSRCRRALDPRGSNETTPTTFLLAALELREPLIATVCPRTHLPGSRSTTSKHTCLFGFGVSLEGLNSCDQGKGLIMRFYWTEPKLLPPEH